MVWRLRKHVVRGQIDNRERGRVRGRLWLAGLDEPVELDLRGNAAPDIAGCILTFENPHHPIPISQPRKLSLLQKGVIGELTASRKVRVLEVSLTDAFERKKHGLAVPEHLANYLYLEWFSETNGRVLLASPNFRLTLSAPEWRLKAAEEEERKQTAAAAFEHFMENLAKMLGSKKPAPPAAKGWDEFDYERFLRECDARTEKYAQLQKKYLRHPDRDRLIAEEMGWSWGDVKVDGARGRSSGESAGSDVRGFSPGEMPFSTAEHADPLKPDPQTEGRDWVRRPDGFTSHPLSLRALEGSLGLWREIERLGHDKSEDADLEALVSGYQITSAKLAGALNGLAYGRKLSDGPFIVACLKRALHHLHATQHGLEAVAARELLPKDVVGRTRSELFALREEILRLMQEFRELR